MKNARLLARLAATAVLRRPRPRARRASIPAFPIRSA